MVNSEQGEPVTDDDPITQHEADWHTFVDKDVIEQMVAEHRELYDNIKPLAIDNNKKLAMMLTEMHGDLVPTITDPDHREGGYVEKIDAIDKRSRKQAEKIDTIYDVVGNGGVKIQIPVSIWVAMIGFTGLILAAVIAAVLGS